MATTTNLSRLLDELPNSVDKLEILNEIKTILSSVHVSALEEVVPNISLNVLFECLDTTDE